MEDQEKDKKKKGVRSKKAKKLTRRLRMLCSPLQEGIIRDKAKSVGLPLSEYMRTMCMTGKIDRLTKVLPKEVLQLSGTLSHLAANMTQIAKKRTNNDELNETERARLQEDAREIKWLALVIKTYLQ